MSTALHVYTKEEKSLAHERLQSDGIVDYYNKSIVKIVEMWEYPQKISFTLTTTGEQTLISEELPSMPDSVKETIDMLKSDRNKYISDNYPELFS